MALLIPAVWRLLEKIRLSRVRRRQPRAPTPQSTGPLTAVAAWGCYHRHRGRSGSTESMHRRLQTYGGDLIRCCFCGKWYHVKCLKLSTDEIGGVWPCFDCRTLSSDLKRTQSYIITLMDQVQHLVDSHDKEIKQLRYRHEHLEKCNKELKEKNEELEIEITKNQINLHGHIEWSICKWITCDRKFYHQGYRSH